MVGKREHLLHLAFRAREGVVVVVVVVVVVMAMTLS
jgi:hypothetical protein